MDAAPSHTPSEVGDLLLQAVERYIESIFRDLDKAMADYREALGDAEPSRARRAYRLLGEIGGLAGNFINLREHTLNGVDPEQVLVQIWGHIDALLRYHDASDHEEDGIPPLHTLLMDVLNSVSFRVSGYGQITLEGEPFPKLPEESDARAHTRLTRDLSSDAIAEFRNDVFATRRRQLLKSGQPPSGPQARAG